MKLFKRGESDPKRNEADRANAVTERMRAVLDRETTHDDAATVENRLRNMVYGSNKQ